MDQSDAHTSEIQLKSQNTLLTACDKSVLPIDIIRHSARQSNLSGFFHGHDMQISVKSDIFKVIPKLDYFNRKQAPFIIAKALTATAKHAQTDLKEAIKASFDRPTPYTLNATYVRAATKTRL
jgi:hypothetical protein